MANSVQINLRVGEDQKARWESYLEDQERFHTLSEMIRSSVESEIQEHQPDQEEASPALASDIQTLREELSEVRRDVTWLRNQLQEDVDISDLAQEVYDALRPLPEPPSSLSVPEGVDRQEFVRERAAEMIINPSSQDEAEEEGRSPQTAQAIAEQVGTKPGRVRDAIEHLQDQFLPVVEVDYQGETHYFKEE